MGRFPVDMDAYGVVDTEARNRITGRVLDVVKKEQRG